MENVMSINTERSMATSAAIEALTGVCAIVLSILALSNVFPMMLTSVAAIAVGFAFLIQGVAISSHYYDVLNSVTDTKSEAVTFTGAVSTEFIGGIGVLTLRILSLINITPMVLLPVAALVLGGIMVLSSGETAHLSSLRVSENEEAWHRMNTVHMFRYMSRMIDKAH